VEAHAVAAFERRAAAVPHAARHRAHVRQPEKAAAPARERIPDILRSSDMVDFGFGFGRGDLKRLGMGLLYNVPTDKFGTNSQTTFTSAIN
jgi:hypothetical protein